MTAEPGQVTWAGCEPNIISHFPHFLFSYCKDILNFMPVKCFVIIKFYSAIIRAYSVMV